MPQVQGLSSHLSAPLAPCCLSQSVEAPLPLTSLLLQLLTLLLLLLLVLVLVLELLVLLLTLVLMLLVLWRDPLACSNRHCWRQVQVGDKEDVSLTRLLLVRRHTAVLKPARQAALVQVGQSPCAWTCREEEKRVGITTWRGKAEGGRQWG